MSYDSPERLYRRAFRQDDLKYFQVVVQQTDLSVAVRRERFAPQLAILVEKMVREQRKILEQYLAGDPAFLDSLTPCEPACGAPVLAVVMAEAARLAGVGPMAAVAGAFAQHVGQALSKYSKDVIVENGGDIYLRSTRKRRIGIFAGSSPLSNRLALEIRPEDTPLGVCTSSGTVGHSYSFGRADAVVVLAPSAALADAVATGAANLVKDPLNISDAVEFAMSVKGVRAALAIKGAQLAVAGAAKIVPLEKTHDFNQQEGQD